MAEPTTPLLEVSSLRSGYGRVEVLHGVSLTVQPGETVTIVGANGAGKSTLLKTLVGLLKPFGGTVTYQGRAIGGGRPEQLVRAGMALVPEGRLLFGPMSVQENLELGAHTLARGRSDAFAERLDRVFALFPALADRRRQLAETLSGGEQQMLAIGRALMSGPSLLLLDEPSLGLAPKVIREIFGVLDALKDAGVTVVLVEQDARLALEHSDRGFVLRTGRVALEGPSDELLANEDIRAIYLGQWRGDDHKPDTDRGEA
jgi:branched-chain amino acid transport system ATP-binding protein